MLDIKKSRTEEQAKKLAMNLVKVRNQRAKIAAMKSKVNATSTNIKVNQPIFLFPLYSSYLQALLQS